MKANPSNPPSRQSRKSSVRSGKGPRKKEHTSQKNWDKFLIGLQGLEEKQPDEVIRHLSVGSRLIKNLMTKYNEYGY